MFVIRRLFLFITILRIYFVMQIDRTVVAFLYIFLPNPMSGWVKNNNIMHIIILDAPLALAMVAGVMPVASIKWLHQAPPCRVLIYAAEAKQPISAYPVEWQMILHNAQVLGNIPHFVDMPTGSIVGWVDVYPQAEIPKLWDFGKNLVCVGNAHRLDEPFRCNIKHEGINIHLKPEFAAHKVNRLICSAHSVRSLCQQMLASGSNRFTAHRSSSTSLVMKPNTSSRPTARWLSTRVLYCSTTTCTASLSSRLTTALCLTSTSEASSRCSAVSYETVPRWAEPACASTSSTN